jgi:hypothetical protein
LELNNYEIYVNGYYLGLVMGNWGWEGNGDGKLKEVMRKELVRGMREKSEI